MPIPHSAHSPLYFFQEQLPHRRVQLYHFFDDIGVLICRRHWLRTHQKLFREQAGAPATQVGDLAKGTVYRAFRNQFSCVGLALQDIPSPKPNRIIN